MTHVFIVNGYGGVGKSLFQSKCWSAALGNIRVHSLSMADAPKEAAEILGWNGGKEDKDRELIAALKRLGEDYSESFFVYAMVLRVKRIKHENSIVFIDSRETKDIKELVERLGAKTILVTNNRIKCPDCKSDKSISLDGYDYVIENNGTIDELNFKAKEFVRNIWRVIDDNRNSD